MTDKYQEDVRWFNDRQFEPKDEDIVGLHIPKLFPDSPKLELAAITCSPPRTVIENMCPQSLKILERLSKKFYHGLDERGKDDTANILPLHIVAAQNLSDAIALAQPRMLGPNADSRNAFIASDADGVFIDKYLIVTAWISRVLEHLLTTGQVSTLEEAFTQIRQGDRFARFRSGFDLDGLETLARINQQENARVIVTTDRKNRFLGIPWFGTPKLIETIENMHTEIPVYTNSHRRKGGKEKTIMQIVDELKCFVEGIDLNQPITVTLISDILHRNYLDNPGTLKSDITGGEGKFLQRLVKELDRLVRLRFSEQTTEKKYFPTIQPIYCAINEKLPDRNLIDV